MLSPAQRYFYDVNGYVLLEGVFSPAACRRFIELADRMDADDACLYKHEGRKTTATRKVLARPAWYDPHLLETALHPAFLPVIEEVVGGEVRLEESMFIVNYPPSSPPAAEETADPVRAAGWHRGIAPNFGSFEADGHYHCMFTKAFIYLSDNGPGQGTWVVPGSHRLDTPTEAVRGFLDATLARQLQSRAGDVLILSETVIHAGPRLAPGSPPRYSLVYGYTPPFMQPYTASYDPPAELVEQVGERERALLTGGVRYRYRSGQF